MMKLIRIDKEDNVATSLVDLYEGEVVLEPIEELEIKCVEKIPAGHKVSLFNLFKGQAIIKYGKVIGFLTTGVEKGKLVHVHNLKSARGKELDGVEHG